MHYVDDDLSFLGDEIASLGNKLFSIFFSNENGGSRRVVGDGE